MKSLILSVGFALFAGLALGHNGLVETISKILGEFVDLIISVDLNGFLGGIHHDMAFVAPMQVFIKFGPQAVIDAAVEIIGQLF
jgi:hypothetical protein